MKIYILTDLEGVAMVSRWDQTREPDASPESKAKSMKLLTWEVNAAIDGILDVDQQAEIVVFDGHGSGGIDIIDFHEKAKLIPYGKSLKPPYFMDESFNALFFVGQHAMAGTENAPLCHTYSSKSIEYFKINKKLVGEFGARALLAGTFNIPTVFIAGDDKAVAEASALVPRIHGAVVKWGLGIEMALHLSAKAAHRLIRQAAAKAVQNIASIEPVKVETPYCQEIRVREGQNLGYWLELGAKKIDDRTVIIESNNICDLDI
ncbi:MAG: M55 family metallopeptidase [Spirochaetota bacterium]